MEFILVSFIKPDVRKTLNITEVVVLLSLSTVSVQSVVVGVK